MAEDQTFYPTFNWRDFAARLARAIEEGDEDGMEDAAKDFRIFESIPCPSIRLGGPLGGQPTCCAKEDAWGCSWCHAEFATRRDLVEHEDNCPQSPHSTKEVAPDA